MFRASQKLVAGWWTLLMVSEILAQPVISGLREIEELNVAIQEAARAVVRLQTADGTNGSAVFISSQGHLLTNNHVLGVDSRNCAREGCLVRFAVDYQAREPRHPDVELLAEPIAVRPDLDAAIFQIWTDKSKTSRFTPPHFLKIRPLTATQLRGERVILIGHPLGGLKKWASGVVFREQGEWFMSSTLSLPGQSGGAYVDEAGRLVGLHHSFFGRIDSFTRRDANLYSAATSGAALLKMSESMPQNKDFISVRERHSEDEILLNQQAYLAAREPKALRGDGRPVSVLDLLGQRCDRALSRTGYESPEHFHEEMGWCSGSWNWLGCSPLDNKGMNLCPRGAARDQWSNRYTRLASKAREFSSERFLSYLVSPAYLETTIEGIRKKKQAQLHWYLKSFHPQMNFELAYRMIDAGLGEERYGGETPVDWMMEFSRDPLHRYQFDWIVSSVESMLVAKKSTDRKTLRHIRNILTDPYLSLGDRLELEVILHRNGIHLPAKAVGHGTPVP